jgi:hypothetical protein
MRSLRLRIEFFSSAAYPAVASVRVKQTSVKPARRGLVPYPLHRSLRNSLRVTIGEVGALRQRAAARRAVKLNELAASWQHRS